MSWGQIKSIKAGIGMGRMPKDNKAIAFLPAFDNSLDFTCSSPSRTRQIDPSL